MNTLSEPKSEKGYQMNMFYLNKIGVQERINSLGIKGVPI